MPKANPTGVRGLYRDEDGQWRIDLRWRDAATLAPRRHTERLPASIPAAQAKKRARDILTGALAGTIDPRSSDAPRTLRKAFDGYLEWIEGAGAGEYVEPERARRDKSLHCKSWINALGDVQLSQLGVSAFDKFKGYELGRKVGPATINRRLTTMKHFIQWAAARGWIKKARALELRDEIGMLPEPDGRKRALRDEERGRLERELPPELRAVVECAAYSGLRLSSVIGLLKSDVDLKHRRIDVRAKRKGQRQRLALPVGDALAGVLEAAMARSKRDHVFVNRMGRPYTMWGVSGLFRKVVERAKIKDFTFHDLRHTYATDLRRARVPVEDIKDLLGHADIKTTMRYANVDRPALHAAVANVVPFASGMPQGQKPTRGRRSKS